MAGTARHWLIPLAIECVIIEPPWITRNSSRLRQTSGVGKPCIRGTRMTVTDVLQYLAGGMSPEDILAEFPDLSIEDIRACLALAADRERKLAVLPA